MIVLICQGLQASGKTTYCKHWVSQEPNRIIISKDKIREMIGVQYREDLENYVNTVFESALSAAMMYEYDIIIDATNLYQKNIDQILKVIHNHNDILTFERYSYDFVKFYSNLQTCITRDSMREHPVGEKVIRKFWEDNKKLLETFTPYHNPVGLLPCWVNVYNGMKIIQDKLWLETISDLRDIVTLNKGKRLVVRCDDGTLIYQETETGAVGVYRDCMK